MRVGSLGKWVVGIKRLVSYPIMMLQLPIGRYPIVSVRLESSIDTHLVNTCEG